MLFIVEGQHFHDRKETRTRMEVFVAETKRWKTKAGSGTLIPVFFQRKFGERTQKVQTCFNYYS